MQDYAQWLATPGDAPRGRAVKVRRTVHRLSKVKGIFRKPGARFLVALTVATAAGMSAG